MVTRKPTPESPSTNVNDANASEPPRIEVWSATNSEVDAERIWGTPEQTSAGHRGASETGNTDTSRKVPDPLRPGVTTISPPYEQAEQNPWDDIDNGVIVPNGDDAQPTTLVKVPTVLRPGVGRSETNPFKRKPIQSSSAVVDIPRKPYEESTIASEPPTEAFSQLGVHESSDQNTNPWRPAVDETNSSGFTPPQPPSLLDQDPEKNVWGTGSQSLTTTPGITPTQSSGNIHSTASPSPAPLNTTTAADLLGDENAWEREESNNKNNKGKQPVEPQSSIPPESIDGWNVVDHEPTSDQVPGSLSRQSTWENFDAADEDTAKEVAASEAEEAPPLPPRTSIEVPPPQPPRRQSPNNVNMSETYQIKSIRWYDSKAPQNPRASPILVQNANGPCPLVALVNALTLTTPADQANTNLVETLGAREQVSLSFLLEVVVDELMSSRHAGSDMPLPDMSELYGFLQGLHTGMNVNPRFIPTPEAAAAHGQISPGDDMPGTFEKTRDMELYATFKIPLIHGWLPPKDDAAYAALKKRAASYDDAQNLLFHEEELEDKFSSSQTGLTEEEQQLYQDIVTIKSFLSTTATQLTPSGLDVITQSIKPGDVSILFRNDHFSTLYRHPQTLQLFTLVTDAGYFTHDEVVWESLVDVRGERAEFFSGDFRVVGGNQGSRSQSNDDGWYDDPSSGADTSNNSGWQTVRSRRSQNNRQSEPAPTTTPLSPHEQEDRDLALALQLQEEEEERHRTEQAARRRESRLSEQYIEQQGRGGNRTGTRTRGGSINNAGRGSSHSLPPPRGSSANQPARAAAAVQPRRSVQQVRSLIPPVTHRAAEEDIEDAPPSYEQAAKSTPYVPPAGHPSHPSSNPTSPNPSPNPNPRRSSNLRSQSIAGPSTPTRPRQASQHSVAAGAGGGKDNKDCIVM
ncbi:hypothetical protein F5B22DRAFT_631216 [Xylaria bambusicola]|uniref:uncharacterized protein n=1 Tax=Xylaria bambusicola TaxID=326684 RepID=UPI002008C18F|nr:uncharacterized protein F5B22DRAFT_631216 [Xylaria bambusicola]KAI0502926.1 hypothetical protein F5B22DRAFT_631216 [Xylaria bambusicola]